METRDWLQRHTLANWHSQHVVREYTKQTALLHTLTSTSASFPRRVKPWRVPWRENFPRLICFCNWEKTNRARAEWIKNRLKIVKNKEGVIQKGISACVTYCCALSKRLVVGLKIHENWPSGLPAIWEKTRILSLWSDFSNVTSYVSPPNSPNPRLLLICFVTI